MSEDTQRQTCKMCGAKQYFEFRVPDELWEKVVPERYRTLAVCLACFDACAFEAGEYDWPTRLEWITFVGRYTVFQMEPAIEPMGTAIEVFTSGLTAKEIAEIEREQRVKAASDRLFVPYSGPDDPLEFEPEESDT